MASPLSYGAAKACYLQHCLLFIGDKNNVEKAAPSIINPKKDEPRAISITPADFPCFILSLKLYPTNLAVQCLNLHVMNQPFDLSCVLIILDK